MRPVRTQLTAVLLGPHCRAPPPSGSAPSVVARDARAATGGGLVVRLSRNPHAPMEQLAERLSSPGRGTRAVSGPGRGVAGTFRRSRCDCDVPAPGIDASGTGRRRKEAEFTSIIRPMERAHESERTEGATAGRTVRAYRNSAGVTCGVKGAGESSLNSRRVRRRPPRGALSCLPMRRPDGPRRAESPPAMSGHFVATFGTRVPTTGSQ